MSDHQEISTRSDESAGTQETDLRLANLIRDGDSRAFDRLFLRYYTPLCHLAARIVKSVDISEDIVQGVFFRIWVGRASFVADVSIRAFLERAIKNAALDHVRHMRFIEPGHDVENDPGTEDLAVEIENKAALQLVEEAISTLPEGSRTIFLLSRIEGLTYAQISARLGISKKTVETQMGRALKVLRNCLPEYADVHH